VTRVLPLTGCPMAAARYTQRTPHARAKPSPDQTIEVRPPTLFAPGKEAAVTANSVVKQTAPNSGSAADGANPVTREARPAAGTANGFAGSP